MYVLLFNARLDFVVIAMQFSHPDFSIRRVQFLIPKVSLLPPTHCCHPTHILLPNFMI